MQDGYHSLHSLLFDHLNFLFKVSELVKYYEIDENTFNLGDTFDTVGDDILVKKYAKWIKSLKLHQNMT